MDLIKTLAYAGLGLAEQTNDKIKAQFDELVESGKKVDADGKNIIADFFNTLYSTKDDLETQIEKNKAKLFDTLPFLKDLEDQLNKKYEEVKETVFNNSKTEEANIVEETK
jgi:polyhydroxyalkanoate synthesis regulator phasin